MRIKPQPVPTR